MSPQGKEALLWTVLFVPVARAVCALPAAGDSRLAHRQARSAANLEPYQPCQRRGFRRDLQLTMRAIAQTNNTMTRMKRAFFRSESYDTGSIAWDELPTTDYLQDGGLVPLFRNLSRYQVAFPDVILQARRLPGYSATLRRSMNNTNHVLNNLLYKLNLTMTVAGELGEATVPQGWTADPVPLPDVGDNLYDHYIRDFVFLHWLHEILDLLRDELVTRLERC
ncbi:PREDICTED: uncharacterized protein LOC109464450 isoform X2 [Branchiostoma belcheri]|uniref:Uncharacterized protein LOC109464450 isoform X2 n=1 Tax=Branchiostoma belcheri TaxID=7741 RepID=A0A6P4Y3K2_BRABE|nr:PREDICTED: uncharacterized protein LOC109464450 isoform X2 [Branchiostoma belcheri]